MKMFTPFALTLALAGPRLSRRHDGVDWKRPALACARVEDRAPNIRHNI